MHIHTTQCACAEFYWILLNNAMAAVLVMLFFVDFQVVRMVSALAGLLIPSSPTQISMTMNACA
jgi:uncharacterized membrane protein